MRALLKACGENISIALRLKEPEILERISEKIEHININGGPEYFD
jgi:hypothetical protein